MKDLIFPLRVTLEIKCVYAECVREQKSKTKKVTVTEQKEKE